MESIKTFINDDIAILSPKEVDAMAKTFPLWRQDYVRGIKNFEKRRESVAAFSLLQQKLRELYGITAFNFTYSAQGKPRLTEYPDIHFNLSHCSKAVACAISSRPVGIDIEVLGRYKESLARYAMNEEELAEIMAADAEICDGCSNRDITFTRLWTRKEAATKLYGEGISTNVRDILSEYPDIIFTTRVEKEKAYVVTIAEEHP